MLAITIERSVLDRELNKFKETIVIAAHNILTSFTLAGPVTDIDEFTQNIKNKYPETFLRKLPVAVAYHSYFIDRITGDIYRDIATLWQKGADEFGSEKVVRIVGKSKIDADI